MRVTIALACLLCYASFQTASGQSRIPQEPNVSSKRLLDQKLAERDKLLEEIDKLRKLTGRPEQVMLHVKILEAPPVVMKELGLKGPFGMVKKKTPGDNNDLIRQDGSLAERIEKARSDKRLKVLATPTIVARAGRPATLMSGGEFPIPLIKADGNAGIEWREFGTRLEVVATNLGKQRMRIDISTELSTPDHAMFVTVAGQKVPWVTTRGVNSQLEIQLGQTIVLAGLISTRESKPAREQKQIELVTLVRCDLVDGKKTKAASD